MSGKERQPITEQITKAVKKAYKDLNIENLEPDDKNLALRLLTPTIVAEHEARYDFLIKQIQEESNYTGEGVTVLNLASARGYGTEKLQKALPKSRIISLELRREYLEAQKNKYPKSRGGQIMASAGKIPLPNASVDVVGAFEILEHLSKEETDSRLGGQENLLSEAFRVLEAGGELIVSVPDRYSHDSKGRRTGISSNKHHLYEPNEDELREQLKKIGFTQITEYGQMPANKKISKIVGAISYILPLRPLWAWNKERDTEVRLDRNDNPDIFNLTHIFVARK